MAIMTRMRNLDTGNSIRHKSNRISRLLGYGLAITLAASATAAAQQSATLTLRSGEQLSGDLMDLSGVGYTVKVNGQERRIAQGTWQPSTSVAG